MPVAGVIADRLPAAIIALPTTLVYLAVAGYAVWNRPDHPAAQRMLVWAVTIACGFGAGAAYSAWMVLRGTPTWGWLAILMLEALGWLGAVAACALFVTFPDGRYRVGSDRRVVRTALWITPVLLLMQLLGRADVATTDLVWQDRVTATNSWALTGLSGVGAAGDLVVHVGVPMLMLLGAVLLLLRYRRSEHRERRQIAWPLAAVAGTAVAELVLGAAHALLPPWPAWLWIITYAPVVALIPVGIVVGMTRHDLLELGVVVRRVVLYSALWMAITVAYAFLAGALGVVTGRRFPLAVAVSTTVLVALLVAPARRRLERLADRLVFGAPVDRDQLVDDVGRRLAGGPPPDDAVSAVADAARRGLRAAWVRVRIGDRTASEPPGEGTAELEAVIVIPLYLDGARIGEISCGPKEDRDYDPRDRLLLETLGRQAVWSVHTGELGEQLRGKVAELEASRRRLIRAEEDGRRRLERDLHDGTQQELVGLLTTLGLASNQLKRGDEQTGDTLHEAHEQARRALEHLQDVVHGIHPTILTDQGLAVAVSELAGRMPIPTDVRTESVARGGRWPADVEAALYFVVAECLTNITRHARASKARICITEDAAFWVAVEDNGDGFDLTTRQQRGLVGLRDRVEAIGGHLRVDSVEGRGTRVSASVPRHSEDPVA